MNPGRLPVAVDAMGGDDAPAAVVAGAVSAHLAGFPVVLVGDEAEVRRHLPAGVSIPIEHAAEVVRMDDRPLVTKRRDQASVRVACRLVREGRASAAMSCGNSGAMLFAAVIELGKLDGVDRPALATTLPRADGGALHLLDIGATTDSQPHHLASYALLGEAWARTRGVARPRVGLLSNGEEDGKGNRLVVDALPLLRQLPVDVIGNVEPADALDGRCDVLVCDGFTGNILIKTAEGVLHVLRTVASRHVRARLGARLGALLLRDAAREVKAELDWRERGGALLLGVRGPVVIGHGRADAQAVRAAVRLAHYSAEAGLIDALDRALRGSTPGASPAEAGRGEA